MMECATTPLSSAKLPQPTSRQPATARVPNNRILSRRLLTFATILACLLLVHYELGSSPLLTSSLRVQVNSKRDIPVHAEPEQQEINLPHTTNLWDDSSVLPQWMKDYLTWHQQTKEKLNESNWASHQYVVVRCMRYEKNCGGASDRLQKTLPYAVRYANVTNRLLLYKWNSPVALEEFLILPAGG